MRTVWKSVTVSDKKKERNSTRIALLLFPWFLPQIPFYKLRFVWRRFGNFLRKKKQKSDPYHNKIHGSRATTKEAGDFYEYFVDQLLVTRKQTVLGCKCSFELQMQFFYFSSTQRLLYFFTSLVIIFDNVTIVGVHLSQSSECKSQDIFLKFYSLRRGRTYL